ncbi:FAD-binding oxidoreductase [Sphingomonas sp. PvP056]|uniref:NAD(P)/FAD-dependent oxidoreductase n=1 Tax=Sphingomonas sp. PvP056 TaxID=3156392 RepID=UPI00339388E8
MRSIGIIGGGVVGLTAALALLDRGLAVTLFDPDVAKGAASWGNAGHIAVEQVEPLASPGAMRSVPGRLFSRGGALALPLSMAASWLPFGLKLAAASTPARFSAGTAALTPLLAAAMPGWCALVDALDTPELLRQDGHIVTWESDATARRGRLKWHRAAIGTATIGEVDSTMFSRVRGLSKSVVDGVRFAGSGQISDLARLAAVLEAAVVARGGTIVRDAARLVETGDGVAIEGHPSDLVLVCAGVRSRALLEPLGYRVPMIAERGYHIRADAAGWPADLPPIVFEDRSMIVTRYADCVQAASFVELGKPDAPADPRKWERLERHVAQLGLPITGPYRRWMGARPTLPDYLPAIGRSARHPNLLYAFGHQHLGLTLAPVTAQLVGALAVADQPSVAIARFSLDRFSRQGPRT